MNVGRLWAGIVAVTMAVTPVSASAGAPAATDVLQEAKRLYQDGKAKFDTVDYEGAIASWTQAYGMLPENEIEIRSALAYNLATAREKSFELTGDTVELKRARILLIKYISETKSIVEPGSKLDEIVKVGEERIAAIDWKLEAESAKAEPKGDPDPAATDDPDPTDPAEPDDSPPADPTPAPEPSDPQDPSGDRKQAGPNKPLLYAGIGTAVAGAAAFGVSAAFMARGNAKNQEVTDLRDDEAMRLDAIRAGRSANTLAIALGATAGVLLTGGAVLIALGVKKKSEPKNASVVPTVGPGQAGVVFMGRF